MKIKILFPFLMLLIITGCSSAPEFIPDPQKIDFLTDGVWLGMLPCNDCEGLDYTLNLKGDFTFKQQSVYKGREGDPVINEGNWFFNSDSVIQLEGSEEYVTFLVLNNNLVMLDQYGDRYEPSLENKYMLHKDKKKIETVKKEKEVVEINPAFYTEKFESGVDFFAKGNEPFWSLEIDLEKGINFSTLDDVKLNLPVSEGKKSSGSDNLAYYSKSNQGEINITLIKENCTDNMSGEKFDYKVKILAKSADDKEYKEFSGCGRYLYDEKLHDIWVLEEMTGVKLKKVKLTKGLPTFEFNPEEMKFSGHASCNNISSTIEVIGNKITFGNLIGTMANCTDMSVEKAVIKAIDQKTVTYSIEKMKLTLTSGKTKMVFKKTD